MLLQTPPELCHLHGWTLLSQHLPATAPPVTIVSQHNPEILPILFPTAFALTKPASPVSSLETPGFLSFTGHTFPVLTCRLFWRISLSWILDSIPSQKALRCSKPTNSLFPRIFRVHPDLSAQISAQPFSQQPHNFVLQFWSQHPIYSSPISNKALFRAVPAVSQFAHLKQQGHFWCNPDMVPSNLWPAQKQPGLEAAGSVLLQPEAHSVCAVPWVEDSFKAILRFRTYNWSALILPSGACKSIKLEIH